MKPTSGSPRYQPLLQALGIAIVVVVGACGGSPSVTRPARPDVVVGATTTIQDSGLLDALVPDFERRTGYRVRTSIGGTNATLTLAAKGDVDVVLVHEPEQELAFMQHGFGKIRLLVMYNDFILVGPAADPAGTKGRPLDQAFRAIASVGATFITRSDGSGTDVAEKSVWSRIGITPGAWYVQTGVGQGQSLIVASERRGYILTDRGTFLGRSGALALDVLVEPSPRVPNIYHVITLDPSRFPRLNAAGGEAWADYLVSPAGQRLIGEFRGATLGAQLFVPAAGQDEARLH